MKLLVFPLTVGLVTILGPIAAVFIDTALFGHADPKFNAWQLLTIVTVFASLCAFPVTIAAAIARSLLRHRHPYSSIWREVAAAVATGATLVLAVCAIINWQIQVGGLGGLLIGLPFAAFLLSRTALIAVHRFWQPNLTTCGEKP